MAWILGVKRTLTAAQATIGKALDSSALNGAVTNGFPGINAAAAALIRQKLIDAGSATDDGAGGLLLTLKGISEDATKWQPAPKVVTAQGVG